MNQNRLEFHFSWASSTRISTDTLLPKTLLTAALLAILIIATPPNVANSSELLMFDANYCTWCSKWEEEIGVIYNLTSESCQAPLRRIDITEAIPDSISITEGIIYTPTFVLIETNSEVGRIVGYPGEEFFWSILNELIQGNITQEKQSFNDENCQHSWQTNIFLLHH